MKAPLPPNETQRQAALQKYQVLDTPPEQAFDDLTLLAAHICQTPIALVSMVDETRQWFKSKIGLTATETPRDIAFCAHAILHRDEVFEVRDAATDPRFLDNPLVTGDSQVRFYAGAPLVTPDGQALGALCVMDRTPRTLTAEQRAALRALSRHVISQLELRTANERLRKHEGETRKLALIAERTDNAVVLTDAAGKVVWVNAGFTRLTGYTLDETISKKPGSLLQGPETDAATVQYMHHQLRKGEGFKVQIINYTKTGCKYWLASEVQPIRNDAGEIINFMAIQSDITERKNSETLLLETSTLQRAMLEGAGYAIIATNTQGIIQLFNSAAERMLGYSASEMVGKQSPGVFHVAEEVVARAQELTAELAHEIKPGFEAFVAKAELGQPDQREWTYIRKDGSRFPVLLSVTTLFDAHGKITGHLGVASDLTERKRDEEKLRATLSELELFNRVMMNREQRVLELKREINRMLAASGRPPAYPSVNETNPEKPTQ